MPTSILTGSRPLSGTVAAPTGPASTANMALTRRTATTNATPTASTIGGTGAVSSMTAPTGWQPPPSGAQAQTSTRGAFPDSSLLPGTSQHGAMTAPNPFGVGSYDTSQPSTLQQPGSNMANPGYTEQGVEAVQNRLLQDPYADQMQDQYQQTQTPSAGEDYLNQNQGSLQGPGEGEQYWNQVSGQFQDPFAGEQFTRQATQNMAPQGPASAFYDQAQQQYDDFTRYTGPQNAQGQYQQNASNGPNSSQQFYDQMAGTFDDMGAYNGPNLAAGQYEQTQGAFGDMPIAQFDPFYDRARQLGVQSYNQDAAGRGVYGSSESLSGVGNVITDIEAQRANRSFDAEMQRTQEQRMRQQLLGEQARAGDLSSIAGHAAGLAGIETYGGLANQAAGQTTAEETMLGNQANQADQRAQDAQNSNIEGIKTYGDLANSADSRETDRYRETTGAMNAADRNATDRLRTGADIADMADDNARGDYDSEAGAAAASAGIRDQRIDTGISAAHTGSADDLARLDEFGDQTGQAEDDRQARLQSALDETLGRDSMVAGLVGKAMEGLMGADQEAFDDRWAKEILPALQAANLSEQQQERLYQLLQDTVSKATD